MKKLSDTQKQYLVDATTRYHQALPGSDAEEHLVKRGLLTPSTKERLDGYRLGYVSDPLPGHETYRGMLAIPYLRWAPGKGWSVVSIRFRCVTEECAVCADKNSGHNRYNTVAGDTGRIYNTVSLLQDSEDAGITEGEFDALSATFCGLETAGLPGARSWKKHFARPFLGYRRVFILCDGDTAGAEFGKKVAADLPNGVIISMPENEDVSSVVASQGKQGLMKRIYG